MTGDPTIYDITIHTRTNRVFTFKHALMVFYTRPAALVARHAPLSTRGPTCPDAPASIHIPLTLYWENTLRSDSSRSRRILWRSYTMDPAFCASPPLVLAMPLDGGVI